MTIIDNAKRRMRGREGMVGNFGIRSMRRMRQEVRGGLAIAQAALGLPVQIL
jgi:hypothetical protein